MPRRQFTIVVLVLTVAVVGLSAHLKVEKTFPATDAAAAVAPDRVQVWYSQMPTLAVSGLALEGPNGVVPLGKVAHGKVEDKPDRSLVAPITGRLAPGKYTVSWKTSGNDGHILTGTFQFTFTPGRP